MMVNLDLDRLPILKPKSPQNTPKNTNENNLLKKGMHKLKYKPSGGPRLHLAFQGVANHPL